MNKAKTKKKKEQPDPIIDGDARPDQYPGEEPVRKTRSEDKKQNDVTAERAGDRNTLEDYKDKK